MHCRAACVVTAALALVGAGCRDPNTDQATLVNGVEGATDLALGLRHSCVLVAGGAVRCWGRNAAGQLGAGFSDESVHAPVRTVGSSSQPFDGARILVAGGDHTCAVKDDRSVSCWGDDREGVLGIPTDSPATTLCVSSEEAASCLLLPTLVPALSSTLQIGIAEDRTGGRICNLAPVTDTIPRLRCRSWQALGPVGPDEDVVLDNVQKIVVGPGSTCALRGDGTVWCWGELRDTNWEGQTVTMIFGDEPTQVARLETVVDIATAADHVCAVRRDGTVACFGFMGHMQLGVAPPDSAGVDPDKLTPSTSVPVDVEGAHDVVEIAVGLWFSCARTSTGGVMCWGNNTAQQLGRDDVGFETHKPVTVAGLPPTAVKIAAGQSHACAIIAGGRVYCWGANESGQAVP